MGPKTTPAMSRASLEVTTTIQRTVLLPGAFHAGNGWEWGLLGLSLININNGYGSFLHSLGFAPVSLAALTLAACC